MSTYFLSNICGAPYTGGKIAFSTDGTCILAPVGNRVSIYDLQTNKSVTLSSETRSDIAIVACHPVKPIAILIDVNGYGYVLNLLRDTILHRLQFKSSSTLAVGSKKMSFAPLTESQRLVVGAAFSPDGEFFAICMGQKLLIWKAPNEDLCWRMTLHRELTGHMDTISSVEWSEDSRFILTASKDLTVRLWSIDPIDGFTPCAFVDHRRPVKGAVFLKGMDRIASVSTEGAIIIWKSAVSGSKSAAKIIGSRKKQLHAQNSNEIQIDSGNENDSITQDYGCIDIATAVWAKETLGYCNQAKGTVVSTIAYSSSANLLLIGFTGGIFGLFTTPELTSLYTLKLGTNLPVVDSVDISRDGNWLGLACSETGAIVVWEWKSETYIMRQQGHQSGIRCVAFSSGGNVTIQIGGHTDQENAVDLDQNYSGHGLGLGSRYLVATGGFDGKVKLWDSISGINFVTFEEHGASVEAICFTPQGNAIISASLDGTVRAFDLLRYKNFRTLSATANRVQFISVACDSSGTIVAAGSKGEVYNVYIWNLTTGKLLDELHGHAAPVTSVTFHPHMAYSGYLVSGSWDRFINIWNIFGRTDKGGATEPLLNSSSIAAVAFDPRGNSILAASILCGHVVFWDLDNCEQIGTIDGLRDIQSGRNFSERFASVKIDGDITKAVNQNQHFNSIAYTASGTSLIAGSRNSPLVCVYNTASFMLMYMISLTRNRAYSGIMRILNSKYITEFGHAIQEYDLSDEDEPFEKASEHKRIKDHTSLPGVQTGEFVKYDKRFHVWQISSSPDSRQFAAATSHGLYIYSLDGYIKTPNLVHQHLHSLHSFQPQILTKNTTSANVQEALKQSQYTKAFVLALALNNYFTLLEVYEAIPTNRIGAVVTSLEPDFICILINFIRTILNTDSPQGTVHLNLHLLWLQAIFSIHQSTFMNGEAVSSKFDLKTSLLLLLRTLKTTKSQLVGIYNSNANVIKYICHIQSLGNKSH
ncbi:bifunctional WD40 repeat/WD40-YVTN repeat-like-containing domain superfamily/Periodic tryptophan protein 2/WD40 repeat [Babesia duncani]|uniref:Bifunctional WD40 repeat/WD40-YVTN repeat-like-containing domain superfamily/Periodic tryptophan protein 2/WD40 repeat n=1 Tax=Babesia duncani TaxID=323732 RepID=A0AAD9UQY5_9APIC|nr:bifunctional WD40 repeat/WD40-YVTN repeat-like-containing domain superfamily/Periodic tryptophan protein 2/WD40 repeat [Babesia duncani]